MRRVKGTKAAPLCLAMTLTLSACTSGGNDNEGLAKLDKEDKGSLKVAYFNDQAFYTQYGNAFQAMFPNVEVEVVSTQSVFDAEDPIAAMEKLIDEQQPDVLYLNEEEYAALAKKGKLYDLDAVIKQDEFDIDAFQPSVIELLKARGDGKLYGLSPNFSSYALYYNKDLFDSNGIPYPTDGMSWDDVMKLAARFPVKKEGDDALFGLSLPSAAQDPFALIRTIGEAKGLSYADADAGTVSISSPEWKAIFQSVIDAYKSGSITMPGSGGDPDGPRHGQVMIRRGGGTAITFGPDSMRFQSGQSAMMIDGPMVMDMMDMGSKLGGTIRIQGGTKSSSDGDEVQTGPSPFGSFEWDVATIPVDPSQPDVDGSLSLDEVFSINASAENLSAAWELVKYINGEQLAKTGMKGPSSLSSRTAYKKDAGGKNIDAFYAHGANTQLLLQELPAGFAESFATLASEQIKKVVGGTETLDNALAAIQTQGQDLMTKAVVDEGTQ